ncbi:MAG: serine/threonine-protein kinase [bacterium]
MSERNDLIAGRYRLLKRIGGGGMGVVWRGWDERLRRVVAVKELLNQPGLDPEEAMQAAERALREAQITARLHHPHAVSVYDVVEHDGRPCLIMEYLPSRSLQDLLNAGTVLTVDQTAVLGSQIAAALVAAHRAGIVHRDVKPANLLLADDGNAKITDFGIARAFGDATITQVGMVTGTPAYLAPEVARGAPADFRSDVYSLGSTLYAAIEGHPPFGTDGSPIAVLHRVASGRPTAPTRCGRLTSLISAMLRIDPHERPTMAQVERALTRAMAGVAPAEPELVDPRHTTQSITRPAFAPVPPPRVPDPGSPPARSGPAARPTSPAAPEPSRPAPPTPPANPRPVVARPAEAAIPAPADDAAETRLDREPPVAGPPPVADRAQDGWSGRRRSVALLVAAISVLVIAGTLLLLLRPGGGSGGASGASAGASSSATTSARTSAATRTTSARKTSRSTSAAPKSTRPPSTTPSATRASSTPRPAPAPNGSAAERQAIIDYYALMPGDLADAWPRMTAEYQQNTAHGFDAYREFWSQFARVSATNVTSVGDGSVRATITYVYKDGRVATESTVFDLVEEGGQLKIAASST